MQVHFQRSVKRVSERVNKNGSSKAHGAFTAIAYAIPNVKTAAHVQGLFRVLRGSDQLSCAFKILPKIKVLSEYQPEHNPDNWTACSHWCDWWMRKNHLRKLFYRYLDENSINCMQVCSPHASATWSQSSSRAFQLPPIFRLWPGGRDYKPVLKTCLKVDELDVRINRICQGRREFPAKQMSPPPWYQKKISTR